MRVGYLLIGCGAALLGISGCLAEEKESQVAATLTNYTSYQQDSLPVADTPEEGVKQLLEGNARYVHDELRMQHLPKHRWQLARPFAAVVQLRSQAVRPELLFDQPKGSLPVLSTTQQTWMRQLEAAVQQGVKVVVLLEENDSEPQLPSTADKQRLQQWHQQLKTASPVLASTLAAGRCTVVSAWFDPATKRVHLSQPDTF